MDKKELEEKLDLDLEGFSNDQLEQISLGFRNGLTVDQVKVYADPEFNWRQMDEIRRGLESHDNNDNTQSTSDSSERTYDFISFVDQESLSDMAIKAVVDEWEYVPDNIKNPELLMKAMLLLRDIGGSPYITYSRICKLIFNMPIEYQLTGKIRSITLKQVKEDPGIVHTYIKVISLGTDIFEDMVLNDLSLPKAQLYFIQKSFK